MLMRYDPFREFDRTDADELVVSERPQGVFNRQVFLGEGPREVEAEASEAVS